MVRQVYWQVTDTQQRASDRLVSSRSTQLGKEDFYIVVIVPMYAVTGKELLHTFKEAVRQVDVLWRCPGSRN